METITRKEAHEAGLRKYFSGVACKQGHIAERYVSTNGCVACLGSYKKIPPGPSRELRPFVPAVVYVPDDMLPQLQDALNDHLMQATVAWVESLGLMTPGRWVAYNLLAKDAANKRHVQAMTMNQPAPLKTTATPPRAPVPAVPAAAAPTGPITGPDAFLAALATMTGAQLDGATELIRQDGEPDNNFRGRIRAQTLKNLGRL